MEHKGSSPAGRFAGFILCTLPITHNAVPHIEPFTKCHCQKLPAVKIWFVTFGAGTDAAHNKKETLNTKLSRPVLYFSSAIKVWIDPVSHQFRELVSSRPPESNSTDLCFILDYILRCAAKWFINKIAVLSKMFLPMKRPCWLKKKQYPDHNFLSTL